MKVVIYIEVIVKKLMDKNAHYWESEDTGSLAVVEVLAGALVGE